MKTAAEVYEVIMVTARRQAETSAQGRALRRGALPDGVGVDQRAADDLDMLLALIAGNLANIVALSSDFDAIVDAVDHLADQCAAIGNAGIGMQGSGDVNATWVAKQLRQIVGPK